MVKIQCRPVRKLYPPAKEDEVGFMVCLYRAVDAAELPAFAENAEFAASGPLLPYCSKSTVTLIGMGDWKGWKTVPFKCFFMDRICRCWKDVCVYLPHESGWLRARGGKQNFE